MVANLQTPSLTQAIAVKLLSAWGHEGFLAHTCAVSDFYRKKRDVFESKLMKYMVLEDGRKLAEWRKPEAGMFYWYYLYL